MFDWDKHYDDVVATAPVMVTPVAQPEPGSRWTRWAGGARAFAGRWAMAGAVALCLGAAGFGALMVPPGAPGRWYSAAMGWSAVRLGLDDPTMPAELLAYDQAQYDNFRRGIARFSDAELLDFLRVTQRELNGRNVMAAYTQDALFLTQREIDRRGLIRPLSSLGDAMRRS
ncbi:hypothetical protein [Pararhodobacter sp.]|uniref:hypothetical protein n=1 Tax=Pararhodobacter sp. TaxID=2127056 RepID=UPI002FE294B7|nr:hypothetical protein [Pseudomonadota bacterium]